jgi:hypothetical protein
MQIYVQKLDGKTIIYGNMKNGQLSTAAAAAAGDWIFYAL